MPHYIDNFEYQVLSNFEKSAVCQYKHFTIIDYPDDWQKHAAYENFRNNERSLCGFTEVENEHGKYLTTTVY